MDNDNVSSPAALGVRGEWLAKMRDGGGPAHCPVCYHTTQLRQHVFTTTMALALIHLYHRSVTVAEEAIPEVVKTGDSLSKLVLWGLAIERPSGFRLGEEGFEVVMRRMRVSRQCVAANGYALWFADDRVWIDETLNQRYSYEDLMKGAV